MLMAKLKNPFFWFLVALVFFSMETLSWASLATSGIGAVAEHARSTLSSVAKLITGASYVAGLAFTVGAIAKFKTHKDNPTQTPLSVPIVLLFVGIALIFAPSIFTAGGGTLFGVSGQYYGPSGATKISGTNI